MPPESTKNCRRPPSPKNYKLFDPWNSTSTGHQRADGPYSNTTVWRDAWSRKLERQLQSGDCAGGAGEMGVPAAFDGKVGLSSPGDDETDTRTRGKESSGARGAGEWRWVSGAEATRAQLGACDIRSFMGVGKRKVGDEDGGVGVGGQTGKKKRGIEDLTFRFQASKREGESQMRTMPGTVSSTASKTFADAASTSKIESSKEPNTRLFSGTTIYVNGSTLPQISDHKLKHLLVSHGARISIFMARKTVSHVIVGQPGAAGTGAGGGLSARKLQQEIERGGWRGVKVVGVDWVLESIKAGKRLAESKFAVLSVAPKGQRSVAGMFGAR